MAGLCSDAANGSGGRILHRYGTMSEESAEDEAVRFYPVLGIDGCGVRVDKH
jgi:hypothetical protein